MTKKRTVVMLINSLGTQQGGITTEVFHQARLLNSIGYKVVIVPFSFRKKQHFTFLKKIIKHRLLNISFEDQPKQIKELETQNCDVLTDVQVSESLNMRKESFYRHKVGSWIDALEIKYNHPVFINWDRQYDVLFFNNAYVRNEVVCVPAIRGNLTNKKGIPKSIFRNLAKRGDAFCAFMIEDDIKERYLSGYFGKRNNSFVNPSNSKDWSVAMKTIETLDRFGYQEVPTVIDMEFSEIQNRKDNDQTCVHYRIELTVDIEDNSIRFYLLTPLSQVTLENASETVFAYEPINICKESNHYTMEFKVPIITDNCEEQTPWRLELQYKRNVCLYNLDYFEVEQGEQENGN